MKLPFEGGQKITNGVEAGMITGTNAKRAYLAPLYLSAPFFPSSRVHSIPWERLSGWRVMNEEWTDFETPEGHIEQERFVHVGVRGRAWIYRRETRT